MQDVVQFVIPTIWSVGFTTERTVELIFRGFGHELWSNGIFTAAGFCAFFSLRSTKAAVKIHAVIDSCGAIAVMVTITTGKVHDVKVLDTLQLPAGSIVVLDRD